MEEGEGEGAGRGRGSEWVRPQFLEQVAKDNCFDPSFLPIGTNFHVNDLFLPKYE